MLLGLCLALSQLSREFIYGQGHPERPILLLVVLLLSAFCVYVAAVRLVVRRPHAVRLGSVLLFAFLFRLAFVPSNFIQEDDQYRYLWDGQVSLQGVSPYRYAPSSVLAVDEAPRGATRTDAADEVKLRRLIATGGELATSGGVFPTLSPRTVIERIGHPEVTTIYPPLAQAVFACIQRIIPWSPRGMRTLLLVFDGVCMALLIVLLRRLNLHPSRVLIYAWSPLVVKEFANSGHMDTVAMAAVLLAILLALNRAWVLASMSLAIGVASKYYPLILAPVIGQQLWRAGKRQACMGLMAFVATLAVCFGPFLGDGPNMFRGLFTYAASWELNAGLFSLFQWGMAPVVGHLARGVAGAMAAALLLLVLGSVLRWSWGSTDPRAMTQRALLLLGAVFLLSPVGDPWYLCWIVPLLCVHPARSWILLTGLVHLYYLGFFVEYHYPEQEASVLWSAIRFVEYMPFFALLIWEGWRHRRAPRGAFPTTAHPDPAMARSWVTATSALDGLPSKS